MANDFGFNMKSIKIKPIDIYGYQNKKRKRALGRRDRDILYLRAKGKCEGCGKKLLQPEMQMGHNKAYSKNGATTLANSICLCYTCNKNQGTGTIETLKKKLAGTYGKRTKKISQKKKVSKNYPNRQIFSDSMFLPKKFDPFNSKI
ncbi:HNH endonuclease [Candidatus Pacearchaeota archaeon]|nr:HNH endonuclease [Candidatus Pacearchaeota archaeon]